MTDNDVEMDATPLCRAAAVVEIPTDTLLCMLLVDEMNADVPLDKVSMSDNCVRLVMLPPAPPVPL